MRYVPCRYARRWPELWAELPDDRARQSLTNTLANGRLEGMEPDRGLVVDLVARARGEMTGDEFRARVMEQVRVRVAARAAAGQ